jgi:hypothetical protein
LRTTSPGGAHTSFRIFPTTKTDYVTGKTVTWEWSPANVWGETWYRDPNSREIKKAWDSAMEFCGRPLDEISPDRSG